MIKLEYDEEALYLMKQHQIKAQQSYSIGGAIKEYMKDSTSDACIKEDNASADRKYVLQKAS